MAPKYLNAYENGQLKAKIEWADRILQDCTLCPRKCRVNRKTNQRGICKTGENSIVASFNAHFGEEAPLVGIYGSGTIFFANCNLLCNFCQNFDISHLGEGEEATDEQLAAVMLHLQQKGCHNINFVTPTHVIAPILRALQIAVPNGLTLPLVYNSSGYDSADTLRILNGIIDIYMPDFKFWDSSVAEATCNAPDYPEITRLAIIEMHRQAGDLVIGPDGLAKTGLLVRHLVMPRNLSGTGEIMDFIASRISKNTYVNIMPQYRPCGRAYEFDVLKKPITSAEFQSAVKMAEKAGLFRLDERSSHFRLNW